jgi:DNA-binding transcriptional LysR family regulator
VGPCHDTSLFPRPPEFLHRRPGIELDVGERDRYADLIRKGVGCAIRAGELRDRDLCQVSLPTRMRVRDADSYMGLHSPDSASSRHLAGWTCTSPNGGWSRCCRPGADAHASQSRLGRHR